MHSMTGYGRGRRAQDGREVTIEAKAVNHRFLDISARIPRAIGFAEEAVRGQVTQSLSRGHVDVTISYLNLRQDARVVLCDTQLALAYRAAMDDLARATGTPNDMPLWQYAQLPDVLRAEAAPEDQEAVLSLLRGALDDALRQLVDMRLREGEALLRDLTGRLDALCALREGILQRAPEVTRAYQERLLRAISQSGVTDIDAQRVAQEVAIFADRAAIDEELSRLQSHIEQMRGMMAQDAPCGGKLNFLAQEMNREVNTIGSKAMDADITRLVVDAKAELEKLREQIQNVE